VESELDAFITKRAEQAKRGGEDARIEELWAKSERKHREKRRKANGWGWIRYHEGLAHVHQELAHDHEVKANRVRDLLTEHGLLTEHEKEDEPMNPNMNGHAGGVAS
jgi:hypothetical protein